MHVAFLCILLSNLEYGYFIEVAILNFFLREVGIMHIHATQKLTAKIRKTLHGVHTYSEGKAIVCIHLGGECGGKKE